MEFKNNALFQDELDNIQDNNHEGLNNISLDNSQDTSDKKKYLLLGIALITVFIITIVVVNFMSNVNNDTSNLIESNTLNQDNILENINPEQRYQEIIEKRAQILQKEEVVTYTEAVKVEEPISSTQVVEENIPAPLEKAKKIEKKKVFKVPTPEATIFSTSTQLTGSYVQLGAFSKYPTKSYLDSIKSKGYAYKVHKVEVNGKLYHKVLIGPFENQKASRKQLLQIRKDLKSPKAFIYQ
jgi:DedD protein